MELQPFEQTLQLARAFKQHDIPFALGGAMALAYWAEPRATLDIDVNVFVPERDAARVLGVVRGLGATVREDEDLPEIEKTGQVRIDWAGTYLDLFFAYDPFHDSCRERAREVDFLGERVPVLSAEDLAVFKVIFNRPKDWLDVEAMVAIQGDAFDAAYTRRWLTAILGEDDGRLARFDELARR